MNNGLEYGTTIEVTGNRLHYEIPLKELKQIRVTGSGEKGFVSIDPFEGEGEREFKIQEVETIKVVVLLRDNKGPTPARAVVEYVILE